MVMPVQLATAERGPGPQGVKAGTAKWMMGDGGPKGPEDT